MKIATHWTDRLVELADDRTEAERGAAEHARNADLIRADLATNDHLHHRLRLARELARHAEMLRLAGRPDAAESPLREALAIYEADTRGAAVFLHRARLARVRREQGDHQVAERDLTALLDQATEGAAAALRDTLLTWRALCRVDRGDIQGAREDLEEALALRRGRRDDLEMLLNRLAD